MANSIHKTILDAVVVRIKAIGISWVPEASVDILKVEETGAYNLAPNSIAVFGTPQERINQAESDLGTRLVYYPVLVILRRSALTDQGLPDEDGQDETLLARQQIRNKLWEKPGQLIAAGAPSTLCDIEWQPGPIIDTAKYNQTMVWQSRLMFWAKNQEVLTSD